VLCRSGPDGNAARADELAALRRQFLLQVRLRFRNAARVAAQLQGAPPRLAL
jgi:hypothetical protein